MSLNVLIASSIIEVGIDIPNATVIVIVGADEVWSFITTSD